MGHGSGEVISFFKLLDPNTPKRVCVRTYELFFEFLELPQIVERLKQEGYTERIAARAVVFLPSAFARAHYEKEGIKFPTYFYPGFAAYRKGVIRRYEDEPVFWATQLAEQLRRDGDWSRVWLIIELSAEHRSIAKIRAAGSISKEVTSLIYEF